MNYENHWNQLHEQVKSASKATRTVPGIENFYRTQSFDDVLEWMETLAPAPQVKVKPLRPASERLLLGTGMDPDGRRYDVVRLPKAKQYRLEYEDGTFLKVAVDEAAHRAQDPLLGVEGGSAFDKAYAKRI